jgi:hypothetical protein
MATISSKHTHEPSGTTPRSCFTADAHALRVELMTYFHAICDVYGLPHEDFDNLLYNGPVETLLSKFPEDVQVVLKDKMKKWKAPAQYLKKALREWRQKCLPIVLFECEQIESGVAHFAVFFHSMTFVRPTKYDPGIHIQFQRLFFHLWAETRPKPGKLGPLSSEYLKGVLQASQKKHICARTPSDKFVSELMLYQKQCLQWLIERETSGSTSAWGWTKHKLQDGFVFYTSVFGHLSLAAPNDQIHGGLLAQDVGMGKTVEMLALIATNSAPGPTLVVLPTTMLGQWQEEAALHVPTLKVVKFHGARRPKDMNILRQADIVLTTYRVVVNETSQHIPTIGAVKWGRIILDESHEMKTTAHATTKSITRLFASFKWCVSATPWPKDMQHVSSMLSFLGVSPFDEAPSLGPYCAGQLLIRNPNTHNGPLFQNLISEATFWQTKRHVRLGLPPVHTSTSIVINTCADIYNYLLEVVRAKLAEDEADSTVNSRTRALHYCRWLKLAATHPFLNRIFHYGVRSADRPVQTESREVDSFLETLGNANYDQSLRAIIGSWRNGEEKCSICMDAMDRPTLTPCHHMFCFECIQSAYQHDHQRRCPLCRVEAGSRPLEELKLQDDFEASIEPEDPNCYISDLQGNQVQMPKEIHDMIVQSEARCGPKIETVLQMIRKSTEKFIVFTQFHSVMTLLCETLKNNGIPFVSIEGRMSPQKRSKSIAKFQTDNDTRVFVMTTKTASVGITLTAGSQIIFLEPCNDEGLRKQAIGRAWRIGQTRPVHVTTLRVEGTIDCIDTNLIHYIRGGANI